jgi:hypothetical protein
MAVRKTPSKGGKPDKLATDALRVALMREAVDADGQPTRELALVAHALVVRAKEGDVPAIKEIFERIDGKVTQVHGADPDLPGTIIIATGIVRDGDVNG